MIPVPSPATRQPAGVPDQRHPLRPDTSVAGDGADPLHGPQVPQPAGTTLVAGDAGDPNSQAEDVIVSLVINDSKPAGSFPASPAISTDEGGVVRLHRDQHPGTRPDRASFAGTSRRPEEGGITMVSEMFVKQAERAGFVAVPVDHEGETRYMLRPAFNVGFIDSTLYSVADAVTIVANADPSAPFTDDGLLFGSWS